MKTTLMFPVRHFFFLCVLIAVAGCGKSESEATAPTPPDAPEVATDATANPATPAEDAAPATIATPPDVAPAFPGAVRATVVAATIAPAEGDASAVLGQLTQVLRKYAVENRRVPKSLGELVSAGYLTKLPEPPAGKKFTLNPKSLEVVLSNR